MDLDQPNKQGSQWIIGIGCGLPLSFFLLFLLFDSTGSKPSLAKPTESAPLTSLQRTGIEEITSDLQSRHAVRRHELGASGMVRLWAGPRWAAVPFDLKQNYCNALIRYYSASGAVAVRIIDGNGKSIGSFSTTSGYQAE